jgi:hypothetical protein
MARVYLNKYNGTPLFSTEGTVGPGMNNARTDVMLVQLFLYATLHSQKVFLAGNTTFTPLSGPTLSLSGVWDSTSVAYLTRWEQLRSEAKAYWAHGVAEPVQFAGKVVPYIKGGKKIVAMNEMCRIFYGDAAVYAFKIPGVQVPAELAQEIHWD